HYHVPERHLHHRRESCGTARGVDSVRLRAATAGGPADRGPALQRSAAAERGARVSARHRLAHARAAGLRMSAWETVIGLEIHAQLATRPQIFAEGALDIVLDDGEVKRIGITRAHLEEDAGKSLHEGLPGVTGIDLNRAGTPLVEIVSEPHLRSAKEAVAYMKKVHTLVRYLEICDGNMQEGSFRCDANVSVRRSGAHQLGTRAEIKNLNSFRFVERAINYEVARQIEILESGRAVVQETRLYDPDRGETRSMR